MVIYPHNLYGSDDGQSNYGQLISSANGFADVSINFSPAQGGNYFTQRFNHPMAAYPSAANDPDDSGRFTSYRIVRTGVKIIPVSNITVR